MHKNGYCADAEWWIRCGAVALGERGTSAPLLSMLEFGVPTGGVPSTDPCSDRQLGWGLRGGEGEIARANRCRAIQRQLSAKAWDVLRGRYDAKQWGPGVAGQLGDLAGVVIVLVGLTNARRRIASARAALAGLTTWTVASAAVEASAQPTVIRGDYETVLQACGGPKSTSREAKKRRDAWCRDAAVALAQAHQEWEDARVALAREWAA